MLFSFGLLFINVCLNSRWSKSKLILISSDELILIVFSSQLCLLDWLNLYIRTQADPFPLTNFEMSLQQINKQRYILFCVSNLPVHIIKNYSLPFKWNNNSDKISNSTSFNCLPCSCKPDSPPLTTRNTSIPGISTSQMDSLLPTASRKQSNEHRASIMSEASFTLQCKSEADQWLNKTKKGRGWGTIPKMLRLAPSPDRFKVLFGWEFAKKVTLLGLCT